MSDKAINTARFDYTGAHLGHTGCHFLFHSYGGGTPDFGVGLSDKFIGFGLFGLAGVIYALVLIVWLREPEGDPEAPVSEEAAAKPGVLEILGGCVRVPAFWMLFTIMACASVSL